MSTPFPPVQGHCPACGLTSLFLAAAGYVTCFNLQCPSPGEVSDRLEGVLALPAPVGA